MYHQDPCFGTDDTSQSRAGLSAAYRPWQSLLDVQALPEPLEWMEDRLNPSQSNLPSPVDNSAPGFANDAIPSQIETRYSIPRVDGTSEMSSCYLVSDPLSLRRSFIEEISANSWLC